MLSKSVTFDWFIYYLVVRKKIAIDKESESFKPNFSCQQIVLNHTVKYRNALLTEESPFFERISVVAASIYAWFTETCFDEHWLSLFCSAIKICKLEQDFLAFVEIDAASDIIATIFRRFELACAYYPNAECENKKQRLNSILESFEEEIGQEDEKFDGTQMENGRKEPQEVKVPRHILDKMKVRFT
ncbi:hypothetical protein Ciccas_000622 [Cichlidogyrus casuarinus]|uniref:Uncharacterized protein n=1 Tax=Cichlidogyrus casuarinus TaxID=1844966 RepID=A0ABD2QMB7_9PLAT